MNERCLIETVHLAELSSSNSLCVGKSAAGELSASHVSIEEAVQIRRALAEGNPAAFLRDLATSLNNLALQRSQAHGWGT